MTDEMRRPDFKVADLSLAEFGRKEIELAEHEMPGLMAMRAEHGAEQPLRGARITGSLHMTIQTAVLIETLTALGAEVRWASCNIFSTQDHAAAAVAVGPGRHRRPPRGCPGLRLEGRDARGVLVVHRAGPALAGRGTDHDPRRRRRRHPPRPQGRRVREGAAPSPIPRPPTPRSSAWSSACSPASLAEDPSRWTTIANGIKGVSEETTTGVHRLDEMEQTGELLFPAINVNDAVTKSKFDNKYGCRHSLDRRHQPGHRRAHRRQGGGGLRLRRRGQGLRRVAPRPGCPGGGHRDRPDLRPAGGHGGLPGGHPRGRGRDRRHLRHHHRQQGRHHRRAHGPDEAPGHRRQHRSLRQRDRHGRAGEDRRASSGSTSSRRSTSGSSPTATP